MQHKLYESIDEMLAPETLSHLSGRAVKYVSCLPMPGGNSGSILLAVKIDNEATPSYVVKHMSTQRDWLMLASNDHCCRAVALWQHNILDGLTPFVDHTIVACAHDDKGYAILMHNIANRLLRDVPFTATEVRYLLDVLAAIHATYWNAPKLSNPAIGLCDPASMVRTLSVETARRLPSDTSPVPGIVVEGWEVLQEWLAPDVVEVVESLMSNPQPLCNALAGYPFTLVHGDYRSANLGLMLKPTPRAFVLDWQLAAHGAATIDLAFFLAKRQLWLSPITVAAATDYYRESLSSRLGKHFDADMWLPMLELGRFVDILRFAAVRAWFAAQHTNEAGRAIVREMIVNHNEEVRAALKWL